MIDVKKGLIMEGGAMRGMFTAGVIDVLMEHGIEFDGAIGVSAGAAFGCNYKSKQIGRAIRYNVKYCNDKRYSGIGSLIRTGNLFNTEFAYGEVPLKRDVFDFETYRSNPMKFYVVCTDVETGKPVYHSYEAKEGENFDWIRASASLPLISKIVKIDGQKLLDGGIADSIPLRYFEKAGYEKNVIILTRPLDYRKKPNKMIPLIKAVYKKYPAFIKTMANRHHIYNKTIAYIRKREQEGKVFVIRPAAPLPVSRMEKDPDKLRMAYALGRDAAQEQIEKIQKFLTDEDN